MEAAHGPQPAAASLTHTSTTAPRRSYEANKRLVEDKDFWQRGDRWIGPGSDRTLPFAVRHTTLRRVEPQFTPLDVIGEAIDRASNALLKREPDVQFVPRSDDGREATEEEAREAGAMRALISAWWDREALWQVARIVMRRQFWAGRGVFRVWVPPGRLVRDADGATALPSGLTMTEALDRIVLVAPQPDDAAVVTIEETQQVVAIILSKRTRGGKEESVAELWTLVTPDEDPNGEQVMLVRLLVDRERGKTGSMFTSPDEEYVLPLSHLPLAEARGELLLTEPVRRQQDQINFANTLLSRVMETAGFPERTYLNAAPHGEWYTTPPNGGVPALDEREFNGQTWYLHPSTRTVGSAITTELHGYETEMVTEADGSVRRGFTTPQVVYRDPTNPEYLHAAVTTGRALLLGTCKQGFVLGNTDSGDSGWSRVQARAEFLEDQLRRKPSIESALRDVIEAVIETAQLMAVPDAKIGAEFLARFRVVVNLHVDAGPVAPDERRVILEEYREGVRSRALTMTMLGTEDIDAELEAMDTEEPAQLARLTRYAEVMAAMAAVPGGSAESAARAMVAMGLDPVLVRSLLPRDTDGGEARRQAPEADLVRRMAAGDDEQPDEDADDA